VLHLIGARDAANSATQDNDVSHDFLRL